MRINTVEIGKVTFTSSYVFYECNFSDRYFFTVVIEDHTSSDGATSKRKRIWSRAVFSKLQRKGLEKRFQVQKYIMKPDRKQLAATLGLTDAQVRNTMILNL